MLTKKKTIATACIAVFVALSYILLENLKILFLSHLNLPHNYQPEGLFVNLFVSLIEAVGLPLFCLSFLVFILSLINLFIYAKNYQLKVLIMGIAAFVIFSVTLLIVFLASHFSAKADLPYYRYYSSSNLYDFFNTFGLIFLCLSLVILLPSVFLLLSKEAIYKSWVRFARIAFPLLVFLSLMFSSSGGGSNGFMSPAFISFSGEGIIIALSVIFLFISLLIIIIKSISLSRTTENSQSKK